MFKFSGYGRKERFKDFSYKHANAFLCSVMNGCNVMVYAFIEKLMTTEFLYSIYLLE